MQGSRSLFSLLPDWSTQTDFFMYEVTAGYTKYPLNKGVQPFTL